MVNLINASFPSLEEKYRAKRSALFLVQKMENNNWKPQNKSQYSKGRDESVWSMCPEDKLPQLKKKYDEKRFGWRKVEGKFYH